MTTVTVFKKYAVLQHGHKKIWIKKDDPLFLLLIPLIMKKQVNYIKILKEIGKKCPDLDKICIINYVLEPANIKVHSLDSLFITPFSIEKSKSKS